MKMRKGDYSMLQPAPAAAAVATEPRTSPKKAAIAKPPIHRSEWIKGCEQIVLAPFKENHVNGT